VPRDLLRQPHQAVGGVGLTNFPLSRLRVWVGVRARL
jgi:hypothetical protein